MNSTQATWVEVSRSPDRRVCRNHGLVLQAMEIPHGILEVDRSYVVVARSDLADKAREELLRYERENLGWPPREIASRPISQGIHAAIVFGGVMVFAYVLQHQERYGLDWSALGRADAGLIRGGEWWRTITALSLHVDLPHLAGNIVFGAVFSVILAQSIGVGLAWWGFLVTGALGNLINAWFQAPTHLSMGASTAVFGALGVQVAFEWMRRHELSYRGWRRWAPLVMGVALLGWLGTGGASIEDPQTFTGTLQKVDVMAHVFGFAVGALIGFALGRRRDALRLKTSTQAIVTVSALFALVAAWAVAIVSGR
ncbi:MAG: rhomboid family intramembrane serine protease [Planctomycetota bacterium]|nr:rhomboid family intramembrane serine protease [Planctomycetota bacterium]